MAIKYQATLRHGETYVYAGQKFTRGVPGKNLITGSQKRYLEEHAKHVVKTTTGERIETCAFDFISREVGAAAPVAQVEDDDNGTDAAGQGSDGSDEGAGAGDGAGEGDQGGGEGDEGGSADPGATESAAASVPPGVRPPRGRTKAAQ